MLRLLPLLSLAACGFNHMPNDGYYGTGALWQPNDIVVANGSLYAPIHSGGIALIAADGTFSSVDLKGGRARDLTVLPDGSGVAAFVERTLCVADGQDDCATHKTTARLAVIDGASIRSEADIAQHLDAVAFAPGGTRAIAWLSGDAPSEDVGVVNLGEIDVIDLVGGTRTPVRVGFAADRVLFSEDSARAVVLSQSEVAVVDLLASPPRATVTYPLTLDPDLVVRPVGAQLTPDGRYALIATEGSGDVYVLDLIDPSVNIISLASAPSAMHVESSTDETLFVSGSRAELSILDHDNFELRTMPLDEPATRIHTSVHHAVLSSPRSRDVYRYDFATGDITEYRLQGAPSELYLAPDESFAVVFTPSNTTGRPGMELLNLRSSRGETVPYALRSAGIGMAFTQDDSGSVWALVLQSNVDELWRGELSTGVATTVPLDLPAVRIGDLQDGRFYIAQDDGFGLISLYDPSDDSIVEVGGFALTGILDTQAPQYAEDN